MARYAGVALTGLVVFSLMVSSLCAEKSSEREDDDLALLREAVELVQKHHYGKQLTRRELVEAAVEGMLLRIDPEGCYLNRDELSFYEQTVTVPRGYVGVHVRLERHLVVDGTYYGSSASRAGILPGDRILEIDGLPVADMPLPKAGHSLVGRPKSKVRLKVQPAPTDEPRVIELISEQGD